MCVFIIPLNMNRQSVLLHYNNLNGTEGLRRKLLIGVSWHVMYNRLFGCLPTLIGGTMISSI